MNVVPDGAAELAWFHVVGGAKMSVNGLKPVHVLGRLPWSGLRVVCRVIVASESSHRFENEWAVGYDCTKVVYMYEKAATGFQKRRFSPSICSVYVEAA